MQRAFSSSSSSNLLGCVEEIEIRGSCNNVCALCWRERRERRERVLWTFEGKIGPALIAAAAEFQCCWTRRANSRKLQRTWLVVVQGFKLSRFVVAAAAAAAVVVVVVVAVCQVVVVVTWLAEWLLHEKRKRKLLMCRRLGPLVRRLASPPLFPSASWDGRCMGNNNKHSTRQYKMNAMQYSTVIFSSSSSSFSVCQNRQTN